MTSTNIKFLEIGGNNTSAASKTALDPAASTYLLDGQIAVVDEFNQILDTTTVVNVAKIKVVQSQGSNKSLIMSDVIEKDKVTKIVARKYTAPQEEIAYIGYNGISGSIEVLSGNTYIANLALKGEESWSSSVPLYKQFQTVSPITGVTQENVAEDWVEAAVATFGSDNQITRMPEPYVKVELVSSAVFTASTGATGTATVTHGSTVISVSGGTPSTDFVAGGYVRIGTTATTVKTLPAYKIASVDDTGSGTIILSIPYQGVSGTFATTAFASATLDVVQAGDMGLKITGIAKAYSPELFRYRKVRFVVQLTFCGTTTITNPFNTGGQGAFEGTGTIEQVREMERWAVYGNTGIYRVDSIPRNFIENANRYFDAVAATGLYLDGHNLESQGTAVTNDNVGFAWISLNHYNNVADVKSLKELIIVGVTNTSGVTFDVNLPFVSTANTRSVYNVLAKWLDGTNGVVYSGGVATAMIPGDIANTL